MVVQGAGPARFIRVPAQYYAEDLPFRAACLHAHSVDHLCKAGLAKGEGNRKEAFTRNPSIPTVSPKLAHTHATALPATLSLANSGTIALLALPHACAQWNTSDPRAQTKTIEYS